MKRMHSENLFSMNPIALHGRRGRGPMRQFSIASVVFVPLGVIVSVGAIVLALWELGLLPAPPQDIVPTSLGPVNK